MLVKIISIQVPVNSMSPFEFDATYNGRPIMEWVFASTAVGLYCSGTSRSISFYDISRALTDTNTI